MLYIIKDIWKVSQDVPYMETELFDEWVWFCYGTANLCFILQQLMFIRQYVDVYILLPLTFWPRTNDVAQKRKKRKCIVTTVEISIAVGLTSLLIT